MSLKSPNNKLKRSIVFALFTFHFSLFTFACSIPNLEAPECTAARDTIKELYSYHFGNDMRFTQTNLKSREKFLSGALRESLARKEDSATDYFTQTDDYPKAFRVGGCTVEEPDKRANLGVLLFWKTDTRSEQREIHVEAVKEDGKWLINKVAD